MTGYLDHAQLDAVRAAAIPSFADPLSRQLLFEGVMPEYVATLPLLPAPAAQIDFDLMKLNAVERLVDGTVPLQIWLHNAGRRTLEQGRRTVFEQALDTVTRQATGRPDLGPIADAAELKERVIFSDDTVPSASSLAARSPADRWAGSPSNRTRTACRRARRWVVLHRRTAEPAG